MIYEQFYSSTNESQYETEIFDALLSIRRYYGLMSLEFFRRK